jgi:hypothetical protein
MVQLSTALSSDLHLVFVHQKTSSDKGSGRGLFTSCLIKEGELIVQIPSNCLPNLRTITSLRVQSPDSSLLSEIRLLPLTGLSAHQQLTLFILLESKNRSFWREYILSLPSISEFAGVPLLWPTSLREMLPPATKRTDLILMKQR